MAFQKPVGGFAGATGLPTPVNAAGGGSFAIYKPTTTTVIFFLRPPLPCVFSYTGYLPFVECVPVTTGTLGQRELSVVCV